MPRIARKDLGTSFFHVIVQGINKEYIFYKEEYIKKYLKLLNKYKEDFDIQILAYCIMNNHAHLLIYAENCEEMSSFMHKVNCLYAHYYNKKEQRVGVLFRNRYESEPIYNERYLINCIKYIHMNPVNANIVSKCSEYKYSTYNDYIKNEGVAKNKILIDMFGKQDYKELFCQADDIIVFKDIEKNLEEIIKFVINEFEKETGRTLEEILDSKILLRKIIKILKEKYGMSYVDIAKQFNISRGKIEYILKK